MASRARWSVAGTIQCLEWVRAIRKFCPLLRLLRLDHLYIGSFPKSRIPLEDRYTREVDSGNAATLRHDIRARSPGLKRLWDHHKTQLRQPWDFPRKAPSIRVSNETRSPTCSIETSWPKTPLSIPRAPTCPAQPGCSCRRRDTPAVRR